MLRHQVSHRRKGRPPRQGVVADVKHATDLELATDEVDDHAPVLVGDPAPDAVQTDVVEVGKIRATGELVERFVEQAGA